MKCLFLKLILALLSYGWISITSHLSNVSPALEMAVFVIITEPLVFNSATFICALYVEPRLLCVVTLGVTLIFASMYFSMIFISNDMKIEW